jgi:hypothetical protein
MFFVSFSKICKNKNIIVTCKRLACYYPQEFKEWREHNQNFAPWSTQKRFIQILNPFKIKILIWKYICAS